MSRLVVLTYHRVLDEPDPLMPGHVDVDTFTRQMKVLARWFRVLPLSEALADLRSRRLGPRSVAITFDDGYADNYTNALPILAEHGLAATFFVATGFLNGGCMWNDAVAEAVRRSRQPTLNLEWIGLGQSRMGETASRKDVFVQLIRRLKYLPESERAEAVERLLAEADVPRPTGLMMSSDQVGALARAGMEIGAHTSRHPILTRISTEDARDEIRSSKAYLEELLERRIGGFAYPNGKPARDYSADHVRLVQDLGFDFAVSTAPGAAGRDDDPYQLPRFGLWSGSAWKIVLNMGRAFRSRQKERV